MDIQEPRFLGINDRHSTVDTSRPFRSVKEAVAVFGERILAGDLYATKTLIVTAPKPYLPPSPPPPSPPMQIVKYDGVANVLRKLESELEDTKRELNLLKERETETEIALASLNAELHKNMAKMAEAEAAAAGASSSSSRALVVYEERKDKREDDIWEEKTSTTAKEGIAEKIIRSPSSSSLAHMLCLEEGEEGYFGYNYMKKQKKKMKKKPLVPLFGDFFSRKKSSS